MAHTTREYVAFISLIGSLFVVAGGIHVGVRGRATPWENARFLLLGAAAANLIGTTGASMVLIRPWLRMNRGRVAACHVVFFIFVVSNCGGALTPVGDPPLLVPMRLTIGGHELSLFTTLTTFGTPRDVTLDELAVELFFPEDDATAQILRAAQTQTSTNGSSGSPEISTE